MYKCLLQSSELCLRPPELGVGYGPGGGLVVVAGQLHFLQTYMCMYMCINYY